MFIIDNGKVYEVVTEGDLHDFINAQARLALLEHTEADEETRRADLYQQEQEKRYILND